LPFPTSATPSVVELEGANGAEEGKHVASLAELPLVPPGAPGISKSSIPWPVGMVI